MKSFSSYIKFGIPGIVVGILISTGVQYVFSWTNPTQAPPNGNTDTPLNVSAVNQTKAGSLTLGVSVLSPIFYDANDTGYYIDPNAMSYLTNSVNFGYMYTTSNDWGLLAYGAGFSANSQPQSRVGSIYANDICIRAASPSGGCRWLSDLFAPPPPPPVYPYRITKSHRGHPDNWINVGGTTYQLQQGSCAGIQNSLSVLLGGSEGPVYSSGCDEYTDGITGCYDSGGNAVSCS